MSSSDAPAPLALEEKDGAPALAPSSEPERWRKIEGFPDYQVSSRGRLYRKSTGRIIKSTLYSPGQYRYVSLVDEENKRKGVPLSRLVAKAFVPNPHHLPEVDHIDRTRTNNLPGNLRWVTRSENQRNVGKVTRSKSATCVSRYKGVRWAEAGNTWMAAIRTNGLITHLGSFKMESAARKVYDEAVKRLHGSTGLTNEALYGAEQLAVWDREESFVPEPERALPSSGHRFVYETESGRYKVMVTVRGKQLRVGCYATVDAAVAARDKFLAEGEGEGRSRKRARRE
jgi:hypothetical protein